MMHFKIILFLGLFHPLYSQAQSIVVGNSGDGYILNNTNEVWIRDLIEYNITESDDIAPNIEKTDTEEIINNLNDIFTNNFSIDTIRLASRIKSLDIIHPLMSVIFVEALNSYNWVLVDTDLREIPLIEDYFFIDGKRIQIANRHGNTIRISKFAWNQMSDLNKNSLIFHEVLYSLMKTSYDANQKYYYQSSSRTREIVGLLFSIHFKFNIKNKNLFFVLFEQDLQIPFKLVNKKRLSKNSLKVFFESYQAQYGTEIKLRVRINPNEHFCREYEKQTHARCGLLISDHTANLSFSL